MELTISGRHVEITPFIRDYVEKKVGRLDRYLSSLKDGRVDIREENNKESAQRYTVQVTLHDGRGTILRGEVSEAEIFPAIDMVTDKMHRQITRFKGKRKARYQRQPSPNEWQSESELALEEEDEEYGDEAIVRTKRFVMSPMSADEAIEQMELLGHTFFVYYDVEDGAVNVVYRRRDGNYGLIIPELA